MEHFDPNSGDVWQWWKLALEQPTKIGTAILPVRPGEFECGYYRVIDKWSKQWSPVGIWMEGDDAVAWRGDKPVDPLEIFSWCCRHPVTFKAYQQAVNGGGWADEPPARIGHNQPRSGDPFETLHIEFLGEIESLKSAMEKPIENDDQASYVGILVSRLQSLRARAEKTRMAEKEPHLNAGRAVDTKWNVGIIDTLNDYLGKTEGKLKIPGKAKEFLAPWLRRKAGAEEARQAAERAEAERQRKLARDAADEQSRANALAAAQEAERASAAAPVNVGRTSARVGIRPAKVGVVTDYSVFAVTLITTRMPTLLKEALDTIAQRRAKADEPCEGMEIQVEDRIQ